MADDHDEKSDGTAKKPANVAPDAVKDPNEKTGGKHAAKIDQATGKARDALDSLDGKNDDIGPGSAKTHGDPLRSETTDTTDPTDPTDPTKR